MKKNERIALNGELFTAINKVLLENNAKQSGKTEKTIRQSVKKISKRAKIYKKSASPVQTEEAV